jgi:protein-S-isoprenylcysteine O-methyltransferase Ste14
MARDRTGLLPGQTTTTLLERGPFRISRNPVTFGAEYQAYQGRVRRWL